MAAPPPPPRPPHFYGTQDTVFEVTVHEPERARRVPEAFVQDLWLGRRYDPAGLATTSGLPVTVLDSGRPNTDRGPDFLDARLRIGEVQWAGAVEIHPTSSGWFDHKHHLDAVYNGVVLHVVLHADVWTGGLLRADGSPLPEVILYPHLQAPLRRLLHQFHTRPAGDLLCAAHWQDVPEPLRAAYVAELATERLAQKQQRLAAAFLHTPNLDSLLHERLFAALGYAKNSEPMTQLARRLPLALVRSMGDARDLEALHLGTAGLLPAPAGLLEADRTTADYVMDLRERFERLQHRLERPPMDASAWRYFRLRPANFPPLRIAQAAALLRKLLHHDPLGRLLEAARSEAPVDALRAALDARPGAFWDAHVRLEKATKPRDPSIGRARRDALIANAVVPVLRLHAEQTGDAALDARLVEVLRALPAASDEVTRRFAKLGTKPRDAFAAQGLHQLYRTRCVEARCLTCAVGRHVLSQNG